jgi:hypothetical protein
VNKDDMSDDAEFDAFLKGEDALSRRLRALPAAAPGAALDAAILQRARDLMAQEARPQAANDAGQATAAPRRAALGWRWRIPAGIAATVLAGVVANQAYQASKDFEGGAGMPVQESKELVVPPEASKPPAPAPEVAMPPPQAAPAPPLARSRKTPAAPAVAAAPAPVMQERVREPVPAPAPMVEQQVSAKPAPLGYMASSKPVQAPAAADTAQANFAERRSQRADDGMIRRLEITGSSLKRAAPEDAPAAAAWLAQIEALLDGGKETEALEQWRRFRQAHPEYPVPQTTEDRIKAIGK